MKAIIIPSSCIQSLELLDYDDKGSLMECLIDWAKGEIDVAIENKVVNIMFQQIISSQPAEQKLESSKRFQFVTELQNIGIPKHLGEEWIKVRKTKKLTNTKTAFDSIYSQLEIALSEYDVDAVSCIKICVTNSWGGFKAKWLENEGYVRLSLMSVYDRDLHQIKKMFPELIELEDAQTIYVDNVDGYYHWRTSNEDELINREKLREEVELNKFLKNDKSIFNKTDHAKENDSKSN